MDLDNYINSKKNNIYLQSNILVFSNIDTIKHSIIKSLSSDLLKPDYRKLATNKKSKTFGHCYAASEALYYLTGGKENWTPQQGKCLKLGSHWWLKNKHTGELVDVTDEQFYCENLTPPYENGKGCGFQKQSKRCLIIMKKALYQLNLPNNILSKYNY